ncbi:response regulator [Flavisolibacter ginsenosidimutans]|nr:response regulator [Flavisolibacter ginsenosidimutans]
MAKILLIDDDPDVRTVLRATLQRQGYEVETASGRDEAFAKLQQAKPALIMMDVLLSGADGRELCREIKAAERTKNIPVIMFSGHPGAALKFETYGANDFISKPFNTEDLLAKLSRQMGTVK